MRVDVHRPRYSVAQVLGGSLCAALVVLSGLGLFAGMSSSSSCAASTAKQTLDTAAELEPLAPIPPGIQGAVRMYLETLRTRANELAAVQQEIRDEVVASGGTPGKEPAMGLKEWLYLATGIGGAAGTYVAAKKKAASVAKEKVEEAVEETVVVRDETRQRTLGELGLGIAAAIEAQKRGATPAEVASILTEHLPGDVTVRASEVATVVDEAKLEKASKAA